MLKIFITGITGTLGTALARYHSQCGNEVYGCCRDELRAANWTAEHAVDNIGTVMLGDCLELDNRRLEAGAAILKADIIYHCAAMKHVNLCEAHPLETVRQNIRAADIVSALAEKYEIPFVFASTDKACLPEGVYGASKLLAETIVTSRGGAAVRFGNLIGSSGSVFQTWANQRSRNQTITLTDPFMTRYFIPVEEAAEFMCKYARFGRVVLPPMRAVVMGDVAARIGNGSRRIVGRRSGETQHQWIVAPGSMIETHSGYIALGGSEKCIDGMSSETAPRWDLDELLNYAIAQEGT